MLLKRPSIKLLAIELETYTQNLLPKIRWLQWKVYEEISYKNDCNKDATKDVDGEKMNKPIFKDRCKRMVEDGWSKWKMNNLRGDWQWTRNNHSSN